MSAFAPDCRSLVNNHIIKLVYFCSHFDGKDLKSFRASIPNKNVKNFLLLIAVLSEKLISRVMPLPASTKVRKASLFWKLGCPENIFFFQKDFGAFDVRAIAIIVIGRVLAFGGIRTGRSMPKHYSLSAAVWSSDQLPDTDLTYHVCWS